MKKKGESSSDALVLSLQLGNREIVHLLTGLTFLALMLATTPAKAQDDAAPLADPFAQITNEWKSPDRYQGETSRVERGLDTAGTNAPSVIKNSQKQQITRTTTKESPESNAARVTEGDVEKELHKQMTSAGWSTLPAANKTTTVTEEITVPEMNDKSWTVPKDYNKAKAEQQTPPATTPSVSPEAVAESNELVPAAPTRQVNLAPLPAASLPVAEKKQTAVLDPDLPDGQPVPYFNDELRGGPAEPEWKDISQIRLSKESLVTDVESGKKIRLAGMPWREPVRDKAVAPEKKAETQPAPLPEPKPRAEPVSKLAPLPKPEPKQEVADPAACNSVNTYMKKQLAAIEKDNETIAALQDAINELGLKERLAYLPVAGGMTPAPEQKRVTKESSDTQKH